METLKVQILCQGEYGDSFESRIYFESNVLSLESAFFWMKGRIQDINHLDRIHGFIFWVFINGERVACYDKYEGSIKFYDDLNKVVMSIATSILYRSYAERYCYGEQTIKTMLL